MNVCVVRNAEVESNAGMLRIIDALMEEKHNLQVVSRTRFGNNNKWFYMEKVLELNNRDIKNYEIQLRSEMGRGLRNIFQLVMYQFFLFVILTKNRKEFDAVHAFDLDSGLVSLLLCTMFKKKLIYHIADFYIDSRPGIPQTLKDKIRNLEYFVISKSNAVVICSEKRMEQIRGSKPRKLHIVHNVPVSSQVFDDESISIPKINLGEKRLVIGYVGGLSRIHFTREILETVSNNCNIFLNIAGYGEYSHLAESFSKEKNNIKYYGRIKYDAALYLYKNCDLMLMMYDPSVPIHKYAAPNKLYEAMMLGKTIIVTKGTGVDDVVDKEQMGLVVGYNKDEFNDALKYLLDNPDELRRMQNNAKNAYSRYSWKEMKSRIQKIYEDL